MAHLTEVECTPACVLQQIHLQHTSNKHNKELTCSIKENCDRVSLEMDQAKHCDPASLEHAHFTRIWTRRQHYQSFFSNLNSVTLRKTQDLLCCIRLHRSSPLWLCCAVSHRSRPSSNTATSHWECPWFVSLLSSTSSWYSGSTQSHWAKVFQMIPSNFCKICPFTGMQTFLEHIGKSGYIQLTRIFFCTSLVSSFRHLCT